VNTAASTCPSVRASERHPRGRGELPTKAAAEQSDPRPHGLDAIKPTGRGLGSGVSFETATPGRIHQSRWSLSDDRAVLEAISAADSPFLLFARAHEIDVQRLHASRRRHPSIRNPSARRRRTRPGEPERRRSRRGYGCITRTTSGARPEITLERSSLELGTPCSTSPFGGAEERPPL